MYIPSLLSRVKSKCPVVAGAILLMAALCAVGEPIALPANVNFDILPPPPADNSPAGLADLSVVLYVQAQRTPEQVKLAKEMTSPSVFAMGREVFGEWFSRENLPKTAEILSQTSKAADPVLAAAKKKWQRPRPFMRSSEVAPVVGKPGDSGSYPSGHSFGIAVPEFVLSAAFPQHAADCDRMIHRVMWGRIVGGVHFPSDTEAGRLLAKEVVAGMLETAAMKEAIETMRNEAAPFLAKEAATAGKASSAPQPEPSSSHN
ncbi:MAG: phosphatase PAP2 family protein [Verrucomicrobiota bacterium]